MDIADMADQAVEQAVAVARAEAARYKPHVHTGYCLNCDESLEKGLFCDADCRDMHATREAAKRRNGAH
jgi:hypothetical protein